MSFINQLDDYILGKLTPNEEQKFQQQLSIDSDLAQEVKKRKMMLSGLEALGNQNMKTRIKTVRKEMLEEVKITPPKRGKTRTLLTWISTTAAIFILGFIGWQFFGPTTMNSQEIFAETYQPYIEDFGSRGNDANKDYLQAGALYDAKNYAAAIPLLQSILKIEPQNSEVELILGDCLLSINKIDKAIFHFNAVIKRKTNLYNDPAQWFLALSYLKQDKIDECKDALKNLTQDPQADYHKEAKILFKKLSHL